MHAFPGNHQLLSAGRRRMSLLLLLRCRTSGAKSIRTPFPASFSFSTSASASTSTSTPTTSWITTEYPPEDDGRVALVRMNRRPANALSLEFCADLSETIHTIRSQSESQSESQSKPTTTVVLSSALPGIFSAGLDIGGELYRPDLDRLPKFWWQVQQLFLDWYGCKDLTTVAALGGHAPAAGCMLALSCDYRLLLDPATKSASGNDSGNDKRSPPPPCIGLNESRLGIVAPPWMARQYIDVLGHRRGELALLEGTLFPPTAALKHGLVDRLLSIDDEDNDNDNDNDSEPPKDPLARLEEAALAKARDFARIPPGARAAVKNLTRSPLVEDLVANRDKDIDDFCTFVTSDPVQRGIGTYLEALKAKANAKAKKAGKGE